MVSRIMTSEDVNERIERLEIRLTHQESALEELTRTLLRQERRIKDQEQTIERLQAQLRALASTPLDPAGEEPPPHY